MTKWYTCSFLESLPILLFLCVWRNFISLRDINSHGVEEVQGVSLQRSRICALHTIGKQDQLECGAEILIPQNLSVLTSTRIRGQLIANRCRLCSNCCLIFPTANTWHSHSHPIQQQPQRQISKPPAHIPPRMPHHLTINNMINLRRQLPNLYKPFEI